MAATYAELVTQLTNAIKYVETIYQVGSTVTDDLLAQEDTIIQAFEGAASEIAATIGGLASVRGSISAALESAENLIAPRILAFKDLIDSRGTSADEVLDDLYDYFIDNSKTVNARHFTRGSFSADGGNTGDLDVKRCTTDEQGHLIENSYAQVIDVEIVANESGGKDGRGKTDLGKAVARFRGQGGFDDEIDREVSGKGTNDEIDIPLVTADDSILENASFGDYTGAGASITAITDWTVTTAIGNFEEDTTYYFREDVSENDTPTGLRITGTDTITQTLDSIDGEIDFDSPYYGSIRYNREDGTASGTLAIHMGSVNTSVAVSAQTGWNELAFTIGQNSWPLNWEEDAATDFKVVWTQTTDFIVVDEFIIAPFTQFDGHWVLPFGGATRNRLGDKGTITDTEAGAVIQRWIWRVFNKYLPSNNAGSESESDPSVSF